MLTVVLAYCQFNRAHTLTTIFFHEDWPLKERSIHLSLFSCWGCWAANSLLFLFFESLRSRASVRVANPLRSRSIGLFVVLQRTYAFFSHSPAKHSTTRFLQLLYGPHKREIEQFPTRLFSLYNSNSSPPRKGFKGTNEISDSLHEERRRQRKEMKKKETKEKEKTGKENCTHRPLPSPTPFRLSPVPLQHQRGKKKLAAVYEKTDRMIPGFSAALIFSTSMKYKKVTHIYKATHRI